MLNISKISLSFLALSLVLIAGVALAQETTALDVTAEIELDENIQAQDLEIGDPNLLPDNPFYFLKEWARNIQSTLTFNAIAKAKLKEKFASEKLIEAKKLVERKKGAKIIERALGNYSDEVDKIKIAAEKIKGKATENEKVGTFLDKFTQHQVLHQRVLQKLEAQVPEEAFGKIQQARERHIERFGEVMTRLEDKENIQERLETNLEAVKGSTFKTFKNLEVLKDLEEKIPEEAKEAIQKVQANSLIKLKEKLEEMPAESQEKFQLYIERISGTKERQLEIIDDLKGELKAVPQIKENLLKSREVILKQVRERIPVNNCPTIEKPASGFCEEGRIITKKDENGCIIGFRCIVPAEVEILPKPTEKQFCITLWDPVCGKNGKTYSNTCYAKLAGAEVDYKGKCREVECKTDADCPQPRCGPAGTISARCIGIKSQCVEGKCQTVSTEAP